jgi:hypothetical protein
LHTHTTVFGFDIASRYLAGGDTVMLGLVLLPNPGFIFIIVFNRELSSHGQKRRHFGHPMG